MGRQNCDPTITNSSIALLQERFRRLERAKELRQQRELLRLFAEADHVKPANVYDQSRPFFRSELILSPGQPQQDALYFQPSTQNKNEDLRNTEPPNLVNLWSRNSLMHITNNFDESDVDTSLHL